MYRQITMYRQRRRPRWLLLVGLIGVLVLAVMVWAGVASLRDRLAFKPFEDHLAEYTAAVEYLPGGGYIRLGIIPVQIPPGDEGEASINRDLYWRLPGELRARSPEGVGTAVWTECNCRSYGYGYLGLPPSTFCHQCRCRVTVVDPSLPAAVAPSQEFEGPVPYSLRAGSDNEIGECPWGDIDDYLAALPRQ